LPTRTALSRIGLELHFMTVVPLDAYERVLALSLSEDLLFAQTNRGMFHAFNAETGQHLWTSRLGTQLTQGHPASVNSFGVFVTNLNYLYALDRRTGVQIWSKQLDTLPSSQTACDEDRVMVGLTNGKLYAYNLKKRDEERKLVLADKAEVAWNWQTDGIVRTRPLPAGKLVAFGSDDGKLYVALSEEQTLVYRIATGGPIGAGFGTHDTRLLLVPSGDRNLYGVDILTAKVLWTYPSGAPIEQEPLVADNDVFVVNKSGLMISVDTNTGSPRWLTSTQGGRLLAVGAKRVYLESVDDDLFVIDRATGQMVADPRATYERIGLNLRPYEFGPTNRLNDRIYFGTSCGMIVCLREIGQSRPRMLRDPRSLPFGYIPREGIQLTPPAPPPAEEKPAEPAAPAGDMPPAANP
jgi:outer membrane protein assembly factor BamB